MSTSISGALVGSVPVSLAMFLVIAGWILIRGQGAAFFMPVGLVLALFISVWAQP